MGRISEVWFVSSDQSRESHDAEDMGFMIGHSNCRSPKVFTEDVRLVLGVRRRAAITLGVT
jgi:hypothetical protein